MLNSKKVTDLTPTETIETFNDFQFLYRETTKTLMSLMAIRGFNTDITKPVDIKLLVVLVEEYKDSLEILGTQLVDRAKRKD